MGILSDCMLESMLVENIQYKEVDNLDGLPKDVKLKDGFKFISERNFSDKHPTKKLTVPFISYEDAQEYCADNNLDINDIVEMGEDIFIDYTKEFDVKPIRYNIDCTINQYEGGNISNTFNNFPLDINLDVSDFSNKEIMEAAKMRYTNITFPNNAGVYKESIVINSYLFEIEEHNNEII